MYKYKLCRKETSSNINDTFGIGTVHERPVQLWFTKFSNRNESFGDEEGRGRPSKVESDQFKTDTRIATREIANELNVNYFTII